MMDTQSLLRGDPKGDVTVTGDTMQVVFRRHYNKPIEKVWAALTIPERLADWMGVATIDLRPGGKLSFDFGSNGSMDLGISRVEPPHRLAWSWSLDGRETSVLFELEPQGTGCQLTLTHSGLNPRGYGSGVRAGWHAHLEGLADCLDGRATPWSVKEEREAAVDHFYPSLSA
ncbi:MAG TPA: SRPBCC family protein [Devosiaceae bacterium]|jgi:uncharacterized protein YndB with AHSA1/START domain